MNEPRWSNGDTSLNGIIPQARIYMYSLRDVKMKSIRFVLVDVYSECVLVREYMELDRLVWSLRSISSLRLVRDRMIHLYQWLKLLRDFLPVIFLLI